jgi:uncharacterized repeat protein (TIGR01451 family)
VRNRGGTAAANQVVSLYAGDPNNGGLLIGSQQMPLAAGGSITVTVPWVPLDLGPVTLYAVADSGGAVSEFDETNNVQTQSAYVGWGAPVYVDAGGSPDPLYDPLVGYGYLTPGALVSCGAEPYQTYRQAASGEQLQYRFDHLLPGRFYHLDLSFYLCSGSRTLRVLVDGMEVAANIVASSTPAYRSILLDPSLYADHSIVIAIEKTGGGLGGPVVSELMLTDIRYCYRDSGVSNEVPYATAPDGCGYTDGYGDNSWGTLPYQSVRYDDDGNLHYRFNALEAGKDYRLNFTFYENDGIGRVQGVTVDGVSVLSNVLLSSTPQYIVVDVPTATYTTDDWIDVQITHAFQPVVSEISLEQKTLVERPLVADLAIAITDTPDPVQPGGELTYQVTVTNQGPDQAPNVALLDTLPAGVTLISALASQGSCGGAATVTCNLGTLSAGATATVTLQVTVSPQASGVLENPVSVTATANDVQFGNNSTSASTTVAETVRYPVYLPLVVRAR